ncbi:MAG: peptidase S8 [Planctomycetota bacterium]
MSSIRILASAFLCLCTLTTFAQRSPETAPPASQRTWVYFVDKGVPAGSAAEADAIARLVQTYDARAVQRRALRRTAPGLFDARDLDVAAEYTAAIESTGARVHVRSRWLNAVSVDASPEQLAQIAALPFVVRTTPVRGGRSSAAEALPSITPVAPGNQRTFYGIADEQLVQISIPALHAQGHTGAGVVIGILDTGFLRVHNAFNNPNHPLNVIAEHDFINNDGNTAIDPGDDGGQHVHGTLILGTLAAYLPDVYVGSAYDAAFVLCKTEDITSETPIEEDNYVAGLEFIELHGGDVATSSLGYIDWYTQADLNGVTAVTTIAVNVATANGLHCCTAMGNSGHDDNPATSHFIAPSDAFRVIACGAVDLGGSIAGFSSDGPTADGRIKPELLARGSGTVTVAADGSNDYWGASGTSLSTPLVAGVVACLAGARPEWTPDQMRTLLFATASDFVANGTHDPLYIRGYGIVNGAAALARDCNHNGIDDAADVVAATSADCNGNGVPDECECGGDFDGDCEIALPDLSMLLAHFGTVGGVAYGDGDIDFDGDVDLADLSAFLAQFGVSCGG